MYSRRAESLGEVRKAGGITLIEDGQERFLGPISVSSSASQAISGADLIVVIVPSTAHEFMAEAIAQFLQENQVVLLNPGHTGGALEFRKRLNDVGFKKNVSICETMTLTYITRLIAPAEVQIYRRAKSVLYSALPASGMHEVARTLLKSFPNLKAAKNVLETGLFNVNAVMHPAGMILNAGWIEHTEGSFKFYAEGLSESVCRIIEAIDEERLDIAESLEVNPRPFVKIFYELGSSTVKNGSVYESIKGSVPNRAIKAPGSLDSRYLHEDVGHGLVPMVEFAKIAGAKAPMMEAMIDLACRVSGKEYRKEGRTAEKLGIANMTKKELIKFVTEG
jgi:opine dehydrogenase